MKVCHVCGCEVDDRELICPECGATVVKHSGALSIKPQEEIKKKTNPMGMTVRTGSGLTNILRNESEFDDVDVDEFYGGSIPVGLSKTVVEGVDVKKKSNVLWKVIKILLLVAAAYGVYWFVVNVALARDNVETPEQAIEIYVDAINKSDSGKMEKIIPSYLNDPSVPADDILKEMQNVTINDYDIIETTEISASDILTLQENIKLATTKTANIRKAVTVRVRFFGTVKNAAGQDVERNGEVSLVLIYVKENWLLETESYKAPDIK